MEIAGAKSLNTDLSPLIIDTLSCVHCSTFKRESKFLKCNHIICSICLTALIANGTVECSSCSLLTPVPNGAGDLEDNFMAKHCINKKEIVAQIGITQCHSCCLGKSTPSELFCVQCNRYMCQIDWNAHKNFFPGAEYHCCITKSMQTDLESLIRTNVKLMCLEHPNCSIDLYCSDCRALVCASCLAVTHKSHFVLGISTALESELADFLKCRESIEEKIDACKQILQESEQQKGSMEEKRNIERAGIDRDYQEELSRIAKQRDEKYRQLSTEYDDVISTLFIKTQQLESTLSQLYQAVRLTQSCDALALTKEDQLSLIPKVTDRLVSLSETIPKQKPIHSEACSPYFPLEVVRHKYTMDAKEASHLLGENLNLNKTRAVATGEENEIFVVDKGNSLIHRFSSEGKQILVFGKYGRGPGEFKSPWGICLFGKRLWVTDNSMGNVMSFSLEGTYLNRFGGWGEGPGEFQSPKGISADPKGCIWVADCGNNRIQRFEQNGKHLDILPHHDTVNLIKPVDVTVSPDSTVWTLSASDPAVLHFSVKGELLGQFGAIGRGRVLALPISIFYEESTRCLLVADTAANCVLAFSETGVVKVKLLFRNTKPYTLHGVSVDRAGRVICTARTIHVFTF